MPPPRPPNRDLLEHERLRKVEAQLFILGKELRQRGDLTEDQIKESISETRK